MENDLILKNPKGDFKCPVGTGCDTRSYLTDEEIDYLLLAAEHYRGGLFFKIMLYCGCRPQEVAVLTWRDLDFENKYLIVSKALKRDATIGDPKTKAGFRSIPIPDILFVELEKKWGIPMILFAQTHMAMLHSSWVRELK